MLKQFILSLSILIAWSAATCAQTVKSKDIDLDALARKVAQETIRSLRKAGALKEPGTAVTSTTSAVPKNNTWQTSTSMKTTSGDALAADRGSAYEPLKDSDAPPAGTIAKQRKLSGLEAGIEAVLAKPMLGQEHGATCCDIRSRTPNHGAVAAPRVWLSWMNEDGYGLRARYFHLYSESQISGLTNGSTYGWEKERFKYATADFELAFHDAWVKWDVIWGLGARHLDMSVRLEKYNILKHSTFKGIGPMASLELRRRTDGGLTPYALFRGGFVAGEIRADTDVSSDFLYVVDDVFNFYEASAGFEYKRDWGATTLFFKGALEAMFMPRGAIILDGPGDQQQDNEHLAILGGSVSFGARF